MADEESYESVRNPEVLGGIIGATVVDVTQHDADEFKETGASYVALHFSNGITVTFPVGDEGFDIEEM